MYIVSISFTKQLGKHPRREEHHQPILLCLLCIQSRHKPKTTFPEPHISFIQGNAQFRERQELWVLHGWSLGTGNPVYCKPTFQSIPSFNTSPGLKPQGQTSPVRSLSSGRRVSVNPSWVQPFLGRSVLAHCRKRSGIAGNGSPSNYSYMGESLQIEDCCSNGS